MATLRKPTFSGRPLDTCFPERSCEQSRLPRFILAGSVLVVGIFGWSRYNHAWAVNKLTSPQISSPSFISSSHYSGLVGHSFKPRWVILTIVSSSWWNDARWQWQWCGFVTRRQWTTTRPYCRYILLHGFTTLEDFDDNGTRQSRQDEYNTSNSTTTAVVTTTVHVRHKQN